MDQYLIRWANKVQGVTKEEYMRIQEEISGSLCGEACDFTSDTYTGQVVRNVQFPDLPTVKELPPFPPYSNPFHHDAFNMGCDISGPWMAMYREHGGLKQEHNKTEADKKSNLPVFNKSPEYIIFINQETGQRFRLDFPKAEAAEDEDKIHASDFIEYETKNPVDTTTSGL